VDAQYGSDGKMFKSSHNPVNHLANLRIMDSTIVFNEYYEIRVITKLPNSEQSWNESLINSTNINKKNNDLSS